MKKLALLGALALALGITACTKKDDGTSNPPPTVGCVLQDAVVNVAAVAVAQGLQCANTAAIVTSLNESASKIGICKKQEAALAAKSEVSAQSVGGDICKSITTTLVSGLVDGAIPAAWGCTATDAKDKLGTLITNACNKAFP